MACGVFPLAKVNQADLVGGDMLIAEDLGMLAVPRGQGLADRDGAAKGGLGGGDVVVVPAHVAELVVGQGQVALEVQSNPGWALASASARSRDFS